MKFFENIKIIIGEIIGLLGGYLWARKTGWNDYEPLILIIASGVGLLISIVSRFVKKDNNESSSIVNYNKRSFTEKGEELVELSGDLNVDTRTWQTKVDLPLFIAPPEITLNRQNGKFKDMPVVSERTKSSFTVSIVSSQAAGTWNWRAIGKLRK